MVDLTEDPDRYLCPSCRRKAPVKESKEHGIVFRPHPQDDPRSLPRGVRAKGCKMAGKPVPGISEGV